MIFSWQLRMSQNANWLKKLKYQQIVLIKKKKKEEKKKGYGYGVNVQISTLSKMVNVSLEMY